MLPILPTLPIADASRRRAWGAACVVLVVIGHLGGLGLLLRHAGPPLQVPAGGDDAGLTVRLLAAAEAPPVPHRTVRANRSRLSTESQPNATVAYRPPTSRRMTPADPTPAPVSLPDGGMPEAEEPAVAVPATHFYNFEEVELPAAPVSNWELDAAALDAARIDRLVFDLFVDDEGAIVGCAIVEPAAIDVELKASLEARLRATALLPATRMQKAVASVRRIEFRVS